MLLSLTAFSSLVSSHAHKLLDWSYMDFSTTVRTTTTLRTIKEAIKTHHGGRLKRLTVCKGEYRETNEMRDESLTLKEGGIEGALDKDQAPTVTLHYNFVPDGCDEPDLVLMC